MLGRDLKLLEDILFLQRREEESGDLEVFDPLPYPLILRIDIEEGGDPELLVQLIEYLNIADLDDADIRRILLHKFNLTGEHGLTLGS